ncbi:MAG: HlyC/CorC family transporter, partial [Ruminococcus sp.]|nr:HlyC/CorC family transporter [Ruminococcus sp.]
MEKTDIWKIALILVMMILSALFSGTETAYSSVNKLRLKNYEAQGSKKAAKALKLANRFDEVLTAVLIGNNIVNIAASSVGTIVFIDLIGKNGPAVSTVVITVLVLIFCEVLPKSYAKRNAEKLALALANPLSALIGLFKPAVFLLNKLSSAVSKGKEAPSVTEDELKYMIDEIEEQGVIEEQESELVKSALEFDEISVSEILIPRVKVVGVELNSTIDEIKDTFSSEMYSRLPVYEKSLDEIVGIITNKAFFKMLVEGGSDIKGIIQEVPHIADTKLI